MSGPIKISSVVLTYNEEDNIGRCLESLKSVADEMIVVDSFSTDKTEEICKRYNVRFVQHEYVNHIEQKQYAVTLVSHDYILLLDADECLTDSLIEKIRSVKNDPAADGYILNRLNNYCGQWIRHSGYYPDKKIRLWNRHKGVVRGTNPHEKIIMDQDAVVKRIKLDILHYAYDSVDEHIQQMHTYALITAKAKHKQGKRANLLIHVLISPVFKFVKKYILQLGFLDGYYGLVFCMVASMLNFQKYLYLYELNRVESKTIDA